MISSFYVSFIVINELITLCSFLSISISILYHNENSKVLLKHTCLAPLYPCNWIIWNLDLVPYTFESDPTDPKNQTLSELNTYPNIHFSLHSLHWLWDYKDSPLLFGRDSYQVEGGLRLPPVVSIISLVTLWRITIRTQLEEISTNPGERGTSLDNLALLPGWKVWRELFNNQVVSYVYKPRRECWESK